MPTGNSERMRAYRERKTLAAVIGHALLNCPQDMQTKVVEGIVERCKCKASRADLLMWAARLGVLSRPELISEAEVLQAAEDALREKRRLGVEKSRFMREEKRPLRKSGAGTAPEQIGDERQWLCDPARATPAPDDV